MKYILIVALLFPCFSVAQTDLKIFAKDTSRHIPNGANIIYIKNTDFKTLCNALLDAGFTIDKKDNELQTVDTKQPEANMWVPVLSIRIKGDIATIRPRLYNYIFKMFQDGIYQQSNKGKPRENAVVHAFLQAYKVAKIAGGYIECKKEILP